MLEAERDDVDIREMTYLLFKENVRLHLLLELKERELETALANNYEMTKVLESNGCKLIIEYIFKHVFYYFYTTL